MTHIRLRNNIIRDARKLAKEADSCERKEKGGRTNKRMNSIYKIARRKAREFYGKSFNTLTISQQRHIIGKAHRLYNQGART